MTDTEKLVNIIRNFRYGEIGIPLDEKHVQKWLSQFSNEAQPVILNEMVHIFSEWYFDKNRISDILDGILSFLKKEYNYDNEIDLAANICFLHDQKHGKSQQMVSQMLFDMLEERYCISIERQIRYDAKHYVYIDDGMFTGHRAMKDLKEILDYLPKETTIDVFFVVASSAAMKNYIMPQLNPIAKERQITFRVFRYKELRNDRFRYFEGDNEIYSVDQDFLWPSKCLSNDETVKTFEEQLRAQEGKLEKYLYKDRQLVDNGQFFSCAESREIVEKEFLLKGIGLCNISKGLYPLGFNPWKSFGFGSICAFDMNISNTCPLVLWWGNIVKQGNALDQWYPLLPRRINGENGVIDDWYEEKRRYIDDQYNMCPDCGESFGINNDGGNGFCM